MKKYLYLAMLIGLSVTFAIKDISLLIAIVGFFILALTTLSTFQLLENDRKKRGDKKVKESAELIATALKITTLISFIYAASISINDQKSKSIEETYRVDMMLINQLSLSINSTQSNPALKDEKGLKIFQTRIIPDVVLNLSKNNHQAVKEEIDSYNKFIGNICKNKNCATLPIIYFPIEEESNLANKIKNELLKKWDYIFFAMYLGIISTAIALGLDTAVKLHSFVAVSTRRRSYFSKAIRKRNYRRLCLWIDIKIDQLSSFK